MVIFTSLRVDREALYLLLGENVDVVGTNSNEVEVEVSIRVTPISPPPQFHDNWGVCLDFDSVGLVIRAELHEPITVSVDKCAFPCILAAVPRCIDPDDIVGRGCIDQLEYAVVEP